MELTKLHGEIIGSVEFAFAKIQIKNKTEQAIDTAIIWFWYGDFPKKKKKTKNYNLLFAVRRVSHHESRSCDIHILSLSSRHRLLRNLFYLIWRGKKLSWILASGHVMHQKHECRDRLPSSCALHWIFELHSMHALLIMIEQKKIRPPLTGLLLNEQFGSRIRSTVAADNASGPELNIFGVWVRLSGK